MGKILPYTAVLLVSEGQIFSWLEKICHFLCWSSLPANLLNFCLCFVYFWCPTSVSLMIWTKHVGFDVMEVLGVCPGWSSCKEVVLFLCFFTTFFLFRFTQLPIQSFSLGGIKYIQTLFASGLIECWPKWPFWLLFPWSFDCNHFLPFPWSRFLPEIMS